MDDEAKRYIAALEGKVATLTERVPLAALERIIWGEGSEADYGEVEDWLATLERGEDADVGDELKPCPFCGREVTLVYNGHAGRSPTGQEWWIDCRNDACLYDNGVYSYYSAVAVMRSWNTRPLEDALSARVVELEARLAANAPKEPTP